MTNAKRLARYTAALPTVEERYALGKSLREKVPHQSHAEYRLGSKRADPVAILERQAKTRLADYVPIRYARMLASPFAFLRGSAAVMAADLATTPVTGLSVQACGDMHIANFGFFASAERNLIFGINDFDETLTGAWEWDLKRLAASAVVGCRFLGADRALCEDAARATVRSYRKRMREYAEMGNLAVWYARIDEAGVLAVLSPQSRAKAEKLIAKARQRGHAQVLQKMATLVDQEQRIVEDAPLIVREKTTVDGEPISVAITRTLDMYAESLPDERKLLFARYRLVDVARKVVGVGSVGTRCWILLMRGNSIDDPLMLQYKEAQASVLAPYSRSPRWESEGKRVVVGQRIIQGAPDIFLGWGAQPNGGHFYIRQLRDMKGGAELDPSTTRVSDMPDYCKLCGWALALAHAKSGDPAAIAGYLGKNDEMDEAVTRFAFAYAEQTERDYAALARAAQEERIRVAPAE